MRGSIQQRVKGSWEIKFDLPRGENGKRRQRTRTIVGRKSDAERELARILAEVANGTYVDSREQRKKATSEPEIDRTLAAHLNRWLQTVESTVQPTVLARYREIVSTHLIPQLGAIPLAELTTDHVLDWIKWQQQSGRLRQNNRGDGLSRQTVRHHARVLRQALSKAVDWDLIPSNPASKIKLPRPEHQEMVALTQEEVKTLFAAAEGHPIQPMVVLAVMTGVRRGELLGLKWDDINWEERRLTVCRSLECTRKEPMRLKEPKTKQSRRTIPLSDVALTVLRRHRARQAEIRLRVGPAFTDRGMVFCQDDGSFYSPEVLSNAFPRLIARAGIRKCRLHDLRHTFASLMLQQGNDIKVISTMLGHSSVVITLDRYSHLLPGMDEGIATSMDRMFGSG